MKLSEAGFLQKLSLERKRMERSGRPFILVLLECGGLARWANRSELVDNVLMEVSESIRQTDLCGFKDQSTIGIIFTELGYTEVDAAVITLWTKITNTVSSVLSEDQVKEVRLSLEVFSQENCGDAGRAVKIYGHFGKLSQDRVHSH